MDLLWSATACDITPQHAVALGGRSGPARMSGARHSALEVNASLLRASDGEVAVVIAFDLLYVGAPLRDHVLRNLAARGVDARSVWLAASHTHNAPMVDRSKPRLGTVDEPYLEWLFERCDELLDRLFAAAAVPVHVQHHRQVCESNVNRRRHWRWPTWTRERLALRGTIVMAPEPHAPRDTALDQIRFIGTDGRCVGVWWKYACHPVALPRPQELSAEYPGAVREALRARCDRPDLAVLFVQGFAGDVRPWVREATDMRPMLERLRTGPTFGAFSEAQWLQWVSALVQRVTQPWQTPASWSNVAPTLRSCVRSLPWSALLDGPVEGELILQRLSIGDTLDLLGGNAEFCSPWLRWGRPGRTTLHVGYLGDVFGYLPSEQQVREGGYEAQGFMRPFGHRLRWRAGFEACLDAAVAQLDAPPHRRLLQSTRP